MARRIIKALMLSSLLVLSVIIFLACSNTSPPEDSGETPNAADITSDEDPSKAEEPVRSAVDFEHELDSYVPKKNHYNFYFTYKTVHPW